MIASSRDFRGTTALTPVSPPSMSFHRAAYAEGLDCCLRIVRSQADALPGHKALVFRNQATEIASFIRAGGVDKLDAVDRLAGAADSIGMDTDAAQAIMAEALATGTSQRSSSMVSADTAARVQGATEKQVTGWRKAIISASALKAKAFSPVSYVVPGYIPEGVTIFAGKPKIGKSWLLYDVCLASAADRFVLGTIKPVQGDVLYLAL